MKNSKWELLLTSLVCLLPLFWLLPKLGLGYTWFAFPLS